MTTIRKNMGLRWKSRVAKVKVVQKSKKPRRICVKLDLREVEKIYATGTLIEPVSDDIFNTRTS